MTICEPIFAVAVTLLLLFTAGCYNSNVFDALKQSGIELKTQETKHFIILSHSGNEEETSQILEQSYERFYDHFRRMGIKLNRPQYKLICLCFSSYAEMNKYGSIADMADTSWMEAYYSQNTNKISLVLKMNNRHISTTTHELAHQLSFNSGLLDKKKYYPL